MKSDKLKVYEVNALIPSNNIYVDYAETTDKWKGLL